MHDQYPCETTKNVTITIISITLSAVCYVSIGAVIIWILIYFLRLLYKKCNYQFISWAPSLWILYFSIYIDILVFISMYWFGIKLTIFYSNVRLICGSNFEFGMDDDVCSESMLCQENTNICFSEGDCRRKGGILAIMVLWIIHFCIMLINICQNIRTYISTKKYNEVKGFIFFY